MACTGQEEVHKLQGEPHSFLLFKKSVNLSFNYFNGEIPLELLNLDSLEIFYMHENNLRGILPEKLCLHNPQLKIIIWGNSFCPPYPVCIKYIGKQTCKN